MEKGISDALLVFQLQVLEIVATVLDTITFPFRFLFALFLPEGTLYL